MNVFFFFCFFGGARGGRLTSRGIPFSKRILTTNFEFNLFVK